jgi:hypothetical protein
MVGLYGGVGIGTLVNGISGIAKIFRIAKVFSLVNELRIIKKSNLLKFKLSWGY